MSVQGTHLVEVWKTELLCPLSMSGAMVNVRLPTGLHSHSHSHSHSLMVCR